MKSNPQRCFQYAGPRPSDRARDQITGHSRALLSRQLAVGQSAELVRSRCRSNINQSLLVGIPIPSLRIPSPALLPLGTLHPGYIPMLIPSRFSGNIDAFVEGSKHMALSGTQSAHIFSPIEVQFNESRTKGVALSTGSVTIRSTHQEIEYDMVSWTRFVSKVQKLEHVGWRMLSLEAIYDRDSLVPTKPIAKSSQLPVIDTSKSRASYKYLTWALTLRGYSIAQDLPGTDSEKSMKKFLDATDSWLSGGA